MTIYYVKQDNTIWGCGEIGCCGEYYEEIEEIFHECDCKDLKIEDDSDMAEHLQGCMGGGPVLKWRKAKPREVKAWLAGRNNGYYEGYEAGEKYERESSAANKRN